METRSIRRLNELFIANSKRLTEEQKDTAEQLINTK